MYTFRKVFANVYTGLHDPTQCVMYMQSKSRTEQEQNSHLIHLTCRAYLRFIYHFIFFFGSAHYSTEYMSWQKAEIQHSITDNGSTLYISRYCMLGEKMSENDLQQDNFSLQVFTLNTCLNQTLKNTSLVIKERHFRLFSN